MKIAIMGAGLSGLACAITLEKHGITPDIYEKRSKVGDRFVNGEVLLSIYTRPIHDAIAYMSEQFGIYLQPQAHIRRLTVFSQEQRAEIEGELGFSNIRGREQDAFESQLARQVKSPIFYNSVKTYEQLLTEYTHVVMATGDGAYAKQADNYREDLTVSMKGVTVEGQFDRYAVIAWFDYDIAPRGYGYVIPYSEKEANIVIAIPDHPQHNQPDLDKQLDIFIGKVGKALKQSFRITEQFHITGYPIGICRSARIGNTFFTGNCFGALMPFMGFGQLAALLTGVYAAHDLCGLGSYAELTKPIRQSYEDSLVLRRTIERLSDEDLNQVVKLLSGYWGEKLFTAKHINPLKMASYLLRPYIRIKQGISS